MCRMIFALSALYLVGGLVCAEEPQAKSELKKEIRVPTNIGFSTNVSPDGQAATVIFDNVYVAVDAARTTQAGTANQTTVQSKVVTLHIPYSTDQRSVKMTLDVRGFADADSGATPRLVACAGDATKVIDLSSDEAEKVKLKGKSRETLAADNSSAENGNFQDRVTFTVQTHASKPICQVTLLLLVDRDTDTADSGSALLAVDSLDLKISQSGKAKYKR